MSVSINQVANTVIAQGSATNIDLSLASKGTGFVLLTSNGATSFSAGSSAGGPQVGYLRTLGSPTGGAVYTGVISSDANMGSVWFTRGNGAHFFNTNDGGTTQLTVSHTASAVNYVQATGAATGGLPSISAQGSDGSISLLLASKGGASTYFQNNGPGSATQFTVAYTASSVNYVQITGAATGSGPTISAQGSDGAIPLNIVAKGGQPVYLQNGSGSGARIYGGSNYFNIAGSGTGSAPVISSIGSDTNIDITLQSKGTGNTNIQTANGTQFKVIDTNGAAVNYLQVTGNTTGNSPTLSASGSDTNININISPKGTGVVLINGVDVVNALSSNVSLGAGIDVTQNTRLTVIEGTNASQNVRLDYSNTAITIIQGVDVAQNTSISATDGKMQSAYNTANNAVANIGPVITTNTTAQVVIANTLVSTSNTTGALLVQGGVGVKGNVATDGIIFADGTRQTTAGGSGGGSSSGYLANSMIIANSTGYLSNTANLLYFAANDTTYHSGSITVGQSVIANNFIKSSYPTVTPTGIVNKGNGTLSNNTITAIGFIPQSMSVDPNGGFLYAVGRFSVSVLSISPATGALVNTGSFPISTSYNTPSMIDPSGRYLYVAADAANMVIQFTINQTTGALTNTSTIATGVSPKGLYVEPAGRFLYTFNTGSVTHFTINQSNGNLTNTSTISAFSGTRFAIDPTGRFLYTTGNGFVNNITQFTINQSNGVLSNTNTVLAGTGAHSIGIEPSGKFLYVTNYNDGTIGQYKIDAFTGILSTIGTVTSSPYPQQLTIDPNGNFLYIIDQGYQVLGTYSINKSTGNLTSISSVVVSPTFSTTWSLTSDPTGRFVYSSNPSGSITQYLINNANFGQANVISLVFPDGTRQITAASGGATVSGYLANSVIIANSTGYLSNTANLLYFAANDTTYHSGTIITGQTIASNTFVKSYYPVVTPTTVINRGSGVISNTTSVVSTQDPFAIKIDPTGRFVYDLNYWNNTVSQFIINQNTGQLTNNSTTLVGTNPYCLAIHPSGNFVYVGNSSTNDISHCTINQANGALTLTSSATGLSAIRDLTVDPTGRFLYAVEYNLGTLYSFTINQSTGTLTLQNTITNGFGSNNTRVVVEPTGRYLYLVLNGTNKIYIYSINQSTGVPTGFYSSSTSYPTISGAFDIVIEPAGRYAYVSSKLGIVTQCLITANGYFNNIATISTNSYTPLAMDSTGRFLYTSNNINGLITQYKINQLTGELTNNSTLPITTSTAINNFALDPKDRFLYGTNFNNNFIVPFLINNFNAGAANVVSLNAGTTISTDGVFLNSNTITSNIVIPVGYNGFAVGPITIANNVTLTVSSNSRWLLL